MVSKESLGEGDSLVNLASQLREGGVEARLLIRRQRSGAQVARHATRSQQERIGEEGDACRSGVRADEGTLDHALLRRARGAHEGVSEARGCEGHRQGGCSLASLGFQDSDARLLHACVEAIRVPRVSEGEGMRRRLRGKRDDGGTSMRSDHGNLDARAIRVRDFGGAAVDRLLWFAS